MHQELNQKQIEACQDINGPLLILAGAGTGKTRVLTHRVSYILNSGLAYPSQILAVTFTNKAANEMLHRVQSIVSCDGIWIGTFHSLATKIIRSHLSELDFQPNFTILDADDQYRLIKKIVAEKKIDDKAYPPKFIAYLIERWKDAALSPEELSKSDLYDQLRLKAKEVYSEYQSRLKSLNALDFGDLLMLCIKLFRTHPEVLSYYQDRFKYIMVDEYQDTNVVQYLWLRYLAQKNNNICAVGDEDQSIYGWRGAEIRNILKFTDDFSGSKVVRLEQNYRSTQHILKTANHLIANNKLRMGKNLWTQNGSQEKVIITCYIDAYKEAEGIVNYIKHSLRDVSRNQISVLVRASFQTRLIEDALIQSKISYQIIGGLRFYDRLEIKNCLAYIKLAYNPNDSIAFERIINNPKRGIGPTTLSLIQNYAKENNISYFIATKTLILNKQLKGKTATTLADFIDRLENWNTFWAFLSCKDACIKILDESGYIQSLKSERTLESENRLENINELYRNIEEFNDIDLFIDHISLLNEKNTKDNSENIKIMTMHAAKGLEFDYVFLPGWEEGIFPSKKSIEEKGQTGLEEERRLAYVAITRAKKKLFISFAKNRQVFGEWLYGTPSKFIKEIENLDSTEMIHATINRIYKEF